MENPLHHITLTTPDMSCAHCAATIESAVGALPGVARVAADPVAKRVDVGFDPAHTSLAAIEAALAQAGYPAAT